MSIPTSIHPCHKPFVKLWSLRESFGIICSAHFFKVIKMASGGSSDYACFGSGYFAGSVQKYRAKIFAIPFCEDDIVKSTVFYLIRTEGCLAVSRLQIVQLPYFFLRFKPIVLCKFCKGFISEIQGASKLKILTCYSCDYVMRILCEYVGIIFMFYFFHSPWKSTAYELELKSKVMH